jgi:HSP20 family molecular chaperone IbpA
VTRHSIATLTSDRPATPGRECVAVRDITDCLIEAYDCVARLAYEKFVARGAHAGGELDDWLTAEHELLDNLPADIQDSGEFITALVSVPGLRASQINIGIESRWLVIVSRRECEGEFGRARDADGDGHKSAAENRAENDDDGEEEKVAKFSRVVHSFAQTERISAAAFAPSPELHASRRTLEFNALCGEPLCGEASCGNPSKPPPQLFAILELPAEVDASRAVAVLAGGLLGLRMPKKSAPIE